MAALLAALILSSCDLVAGFGFRPPPCHGLYVDNFRSLEQLVDRADLIVRASVVRRETRGEGHSSRYRTLVRVSETLKGSAGGMSELSVIESSCPAFYLVDRPEWLLFLVASTTFDGYYLPGGPRAAFPLRDGRVDGALDGAELVRKYEGTPYPELKEQLARIDGLDDDAARLFRASGWTAVATAGIRVFNVPPVSEFGETNLPPRVERPFPGYAEIAAKTGLDLRPHAGKEAEELLLTLEPGIQRGRNAPAGHVVIVDRRIVGAWVVVGPQQAIFRVDERAAALAVLPVEPTIGAPRNRFPSGVNVVREYRLRQADSIFVKRAQPQPSYGETSDPARIAEILSLLDANLPTDAADRPNTETMWVVRFDIGAQSVVLMYDPRTGRLSQWDDGFSVRPDPRFRALVDALAQER